MNCEPVFEGVSDHAVHATVMAGLPLSRYDDFMYIDEGKRSLGRDLLDVAYVYGSSAGMPAKYWDAEVQRG